MKFFKPLTAIASVVTLGTVFAPPALASFGDFMLGVGATVGVGAIVNSVQRSNEADRNRPVSPQDEYFRGLQDGINGARYDNPRNSPDYDRGFKEGAQRRNQR
jgi:hypothetical protein